MWAGTRPTVDESHFQYSMALESTDGNRKYEKRTFFEAFFQMNKRRPRRAASLMKNAKWCWESHKMKTLVINSFIIQTIKDLKSIKIVIVIFRSKVTQTALSSIPSLLPLAKTESQSCFSTLQRDHLHSGSSDGDRWQLVCSELGEKPSRDNANSNLGPRRKARKKTQHADVGQEHRASRYEGSHQFFVSIFLVADNGVSLGPVSGLSTSLESFSTSARIFPLLRWKLRCWSALVLTFAL